MKKCNIIFPIVVMGLFACTPARKAPAPKKQDGYLKKDISQKELFNKDNYKRYYYTCRSLETGESFSLSNYFPLSKESRLKDNFGFYFQLNGRTVEPFDHIENKALNMKGSRFEVIYRSYAPIQGAQIELIAREKGSTYYKLLNSTRYPWLECQEL